MLKFLTLLAALTAMASNALADTLTITNNTNDTIYSLYAWPTELATHTLNLLGFPLTPGTSEDIDVDNSYGECDFTFETNPNDPADKKKPKRAFIPRKDIELRDINICNKSGQVSIDPEADRL